MKIKTSQFGKIEFNEDNVILFNDGILGFEELKKYLLISEKDGLFFWLSSVEQPEIIFPLFAIKLLKENYHQEENYEPYGIVKLDKEPSKITVNLKSPIYIDQKNRVGFQTILDVDKYPIDYQLFVKN